MGVEQNYQKGQQAFKLQGIITEGMTERMDKRGELAERRAGMDTSRGEYLENREGFGGYGGA